MPRIIEQKRQHETWKVPKSFKNHETYDLGRFRRRLGAQGCFRNGPGEAYGKFAGAFLAPLWRYWGVFWHPSDFEGIPKTTIFETILKQMRKEIQEAALKKHDFSIDF